MSLIDIWNFIINVNLISVAIGIAIVIFALVCLAYVIIFIGTTVTFISNLFSEKTWGLIGTWIKRILIGLVIIFFIYIFFID